MSIDDDDRPGGGVDPSSRRRPDARKRRIVVGAAGAAAALGVGVYALTSHLTAKDSTAPQDTGALAPIVPASAPVSFDAAPPSAPASTVPAISPSASPAASASSAQQATAATTPGVITHPTTLSSKVRKEIDEARAKAAEDGHPLVRPLEPSGSPVGMSTRVEQTARAMIRITTARANLHGQGDQLMAADAGQPAGHARCTHNVRFGSNAQPRTIPNMIVCWRTSSSRSVVTMTVGKKATPSAAESAAVIEEEWAKLG